MGERSLLYWIGVVVISLVGCEQAEPQQERIEVASCAPVLRRRRGVRGRRDELHLAGLRVWRRGQRIVLARLPAAARRMPRAERARDLRLPMRDTLRKVLQGRLRPDERAPQAFSRWPKRAGSLPEVTRDLRRLPEVSAQRALQVVFALRVPIEPPLDETGLQGGRPDRGAGHSSGGASYGSQPHRQGQDACTQQLEESDLVEDGVRHSVLPSTQERRRLGKGLRAIPRGQVPHRFSGNRPGREPAIRHRKSGEVHGAVRRDRGPRNIPIRSDLYRR